MRPSYSSPSLRPRQCHSWVALVLAWCFAALNGAAFADMLPSGLTVPSSVYGASYADVAVPDAGVAVGAAIAIGGAPAGSIVTSVQVAFDVVHEYPGDLAVWLVGNNSAGQQRTKVLWNPGSRTETGLAATTVTTFNGAAANQRWQLVVQDTRTGDVGYLDQWSIRVSYLAPPALRLPGTNAETGYLIGTLTPSLQWNTAFGATRYRVRAQASPYDALSTVYEGTINGTSGTAATLPPGRLLHGGAYRWLATSITSVGVESGFGTPLFFATPPAGVLVTPTLIAPGNSGDNTRAFLPNVPPTFQWQSVVGATGYKVRVSEYPYDTTNEVMAQTVGLATSFTRAAGALIPGVRYRWTVTGLYPGGESTPWQSALYFELTEPAAPQLTANPVSRTLTRGAPFSTPILATNAPTNYSAVDLPPGLAVDASTGQITGAAVDIGIYEVLLRAGNAFGSGNQSVLFNVVPPAPTITSPANTTSFVGRPFSYQILATENPTVFAIATLPAGLALDPDTGLITGAFTGEGTFAIPLQASNSGGTGTRTLDVVVTSGGPYDTKLFPRGVHENQPLGTVIGNFSTLDGEGPQPFVYALVAGAGADDNALFEIRPGEAALRTLAVFDYETRNVFSIRVRTTDTSGQSFEKQVTIRVLNVIGETQGGLHLSDATVLENRPAGTLVGFLSAVDPDPGETFTFMLVSGPGSTDNAKFQIVGNELRTATAFNFEVQRFFNVRIRVTDSGANTLEETAVIEALDDTAEDFDGDGLTQAQEAAIGTSDLIADTDGDGASDGAEVLAGTNPLDNGSFPDRTVFTWGANSYGQRNVPGTVGGVVGIAAGDSYTLALKADGTVAEWGAEVVPAGLGGVVEIAAGANSLALKSDGTVVAFGHEVPAGLSGVVGIAAGGYIHSLALKSDGTVVAWGSNDWGEANVPAGLSGVVGIAAGSIHSLALKSDGTVVGWGYNAHGEINVPVGLSGVVAVAAGSDHSLALKADGTVVAWGREGEIEVPAGLSEVVAVAAVRSHSLALKSDGTVVAWGYNAQGEIDVPAGLSGVVAVAAGIEHSVVIRSNGSPPRITGGLSVAGSVGQAISHQIATTVPAQSYAAMGLPPGLALDTATGVITGTPTVAGRYAVRLSADNSAGRNVKVVLMPITVGSPPTDIALSSSAVLENRPVGTVVGFLNAVDPDPGETFTFMLVSGAGNADNGKFSIVGNQLKTAAALDFEAQRFYNIRIRVSDSGGNVLDETAIIEALDDTAEDFDGDGLTQAQEATIGTSDFIKDTDGDGAGDGAEVAAGTNPLDSSSFPDRTVFAWGLNSSGQCNAPGTLSGVVGIAAGDSYSFALKSDGTVVGWGGGVEVAGLSGVVEIAAGAHSFALKSDGTLVALVGNDVPAGLSGVVRIATGGYPPHFLALKSDGTVVAWGTNTFGESEVPAGLSGVVGIAAGSIHSLALKSDGAVVGWGYNAHGEINVPVGLSGVVAVAAGSDHSVALKSDGTVVAWGFNNFGQIDVPAGLSDVVAVAAVRAHSLALKSDGTVVTWGSNNDGESEVPAGLSGAVSLTAGWWHSVVIRSNGSPPRITGGLSVAGSVGQAFSHQIATTVPAQSYAAMGLPPGLALDTATGVITGTPTVAGRYAVRLSADNSAGRNVKVVLMPITVGSPPTDIALSSSAVLENRPVGTVVGFLNAVDPDPGETFTFMLVSGVGSTDNGKFSIAGNQLKTAVVFDYEVKSQYSIRVRVTDGGGNTLEEVATVGILDDATEDFDGDGLTQAQEAALGTSDLNMDTDGDGAGDGVEVATGTNPLDSSSFPDRRVFAWGLNSASQCNVPGTLSGVVGIAAGDSYSAALKSDGTVVPWGADIGLAGLSGVVEIAAGAHWFALKSDGTVVGLAVGEVPAGLSGVVRIATGGYPPHSLALKSDGTVVAWGTNTFGESDVPAGLSGVVGIAAGAIHSLALKSDGTVVGWGYNAHGEINVPVGLSGVVAVAAGSDHSVALKSDGTVVAWGREGEIEVPAGLSEVVAVAAVRSHSLALKSDGTVVAWGYNAQGQINVPVGFSGAVAVAAGYEHSVVIRSNGSPPRITGGLSVAGSVGQAFSHQIATTMSAQSFAAMGLPPGLALDPATGLITGTPTTAGRYAVRLSADNSAGRDVKVIFMPMTSGSPPTAIGLTSNVVEEDVPVGTVVARLLVQYAGGLAGVSKGLSVAPSASFAFVAGTGDANNGMFAIVGDALVTAAPLDYESVSALHVRVRATDAGANVIDQEITIQVLDVVEGETLANWQFRNGIGDLTQQTAGDGLTALQKYAFGLDPAKPAASPLRAQRTAMTNGQDYLTVIFPRAFGGTTNGDGSYTYAGLIYRVEWSGDLVNWSSEGVAIVASGPAAGSPAGYRSVMARSPVALTAQPRQFMRIVVTAP